jgi:hypothetical protein
MKVVKKTVVEIGMTGEQFCGLRAAVVDAIKTTGYDVPKGASCVQVTLDPEDVQTRNELRPAAFGARALTPTVIVSWVEDG